MKKLKNYKIRSFLAHRQCDLLAILSMAFAASPLLLRADETASPVLLEFTSGFVGEQVKLSWTAEPGARYWIEKSATLAGDWSQVALVEATTTAAQWLDPERKTQKSFYSITKPQPLVFALEPPVISSLGGDIFVRGQALPPGAMLRLNTDPTVSSVLEPVAGKPGLWRASFSSAAISGITGGAIAGIVVATIADSQGTTICPVDQQIQITTNGFAQDAPPSLPPGAPMPDGASKPVPSIGIVVKKNPGTSNSSRPSSGTNSTDLISPFLSKKGYDYSLARSDHAATATTNSTPPTGLPGEVTLQACPLPVATPAGPPLACILTYRSMVASGSPSFFGPNWTCSYDISVTPIPANAGAGATHVKVCDGAGRCDTYVRQADGTFVCDGMSRTGRFTGESFTLTFADQGKWVFCPFNGSPKQGKILSIIDRNNVALSCDYNPQSGMLVSVSSQFSQSLNFTRNGDGQVTRITDHTGRYCTFSYYASGSSDGNPTMLQAYSSPQLDGVASVVGNSTFTYTTGCPSPRCDDNLLTCRDGAGRLISGFTYASSASPLAVDFDRVISQRCTDAADVPACVSSYTATDGGLLVCDNDEIGRVTISGYDGSHRLTRGRRYTGFSTPGIPVTPTENLPTGKLRDTDPDYYQFTFAYNAQHCPTVITAPDGLKTRCIYQYDLTRMECPILARANMRVCSLVSSTNEARTVSMEYLPGFGAPEPASSLPSTDTFSLFRKGWDGSVKGGRKFQVSDNGESEPSLFRKGWDGTVKGGSKFLLSDSGESEPSLFRKGWDGTVKGGSKFQLSDSGEGEPSAFRKGWDGSVKGNIAENRCPDGACRATAVMDKGWDGSVKGNIARHLCPSGACRATTVMDKGWDGSVKGLTQAGPSLIAGNIGSSGQDGVSLTCPKVGPIVHVAVGVTPNKSLRCIGGDFSCVARCDASVFVTSMTTTLGQKFSWSYDVHGNCTSTTNSLPGQGTLFEYNNKGQCTSVAESNGQGLPFRDVYAYDAATGFLSSVTYDQQQNGSGLKIVYGCIRNPAGNITRVVDPRGNDWLYDYNTLDECVRIKTPVVGSHRITTDCFYDAGGQPTGYDVEQRDATGALVSANPACSTRYLRESPTCPFAISRIAVENRPTSLAPGSTDLGTSLANFDVCDYTYNAAGDCIEVRTPADCRAQATDAVCSTTFDERGMLHRCISGAAGSLDAVTTQYDYTLAGDLARCVTLTSPLADCPTEAFLYDSFRRCISATDAMGNVETYAYDNQGFVTASLYGELNDVVGSDENILLARVRHGGIITGSVIIASGNRCINPFFDLATEDTTTTVDRFCPGTASPVVQDVTTVDRSPAGLVMSVSTNGDTLETNEYDSAGRLGRRTYTGGRFAFTLDGVGNMLTCTRTDFPSAGGNSVEGNSCTIVYDALDRPVQVTAGPCVSSCEYDSLGRTTRYTPPTGAAIVYDYDGGTASSPFSVRARCNVDGDIPETLGTCYARGFGSFSGAQEDDTSPTAKHYITIPHVCATTDSNGATTSFVRDSQGRCVQTNFADGTHESCVFDRLGRMISQTRQDSTVTEMSHDLNGRVTSASTAPTTTYGYNGQDDCVSMSQGSSLILCPRDSYGNPRFESQNGHVVAYTYNHRGRTSTTAPSGACYLENRNAQGQLLSVTLQDAPPASPAIASFQYKGPNLVKETRANGVVTTYQYRGPKDQQLAGASDFSLDACVRCIVTDQANTVLSRTTFARDRNQQLTDCITFFSGLPNNVSPLRHQVISRDSLGRLVGMSTQVRSSIDGSIVLESEVAYTLDLEGKRLTASGGAHPGSYTQSAPGDLPMHQYSTWPGGDLLWNDNGDLAQITYDANSSQQFTYDAQSRLIAVTDVATNTSVASYGYDAQNRLISRTVPNSQPGSPPVTTFFVYDGNRCLEELDANGVPQVTFAAMGLCIVPINGDPIYPHAGGFANGVSLMTNNTGAAVEYFACDDAGKPIFLDSIGTVRTEASSAISAVNWLAPDCVWCPESRLFMCPGGNYCPDLGQVVSRKVKTKDVAPYRDGKKEFKGHVSLLK